MALRGGSKGPRARLVREEQQTLFSSSEVKVLVGHGIRAALGQALKARGRHVDAGRLGRLELHFAGLYIKTPVTGTTPYPHAVEVLCALRGQRIAVGVCTNKSEAAARLVIDGTGLGAEGTICCLSELSATLAKIASGNRPCP